MQQLLLTVIGTFLLASAGTLPADETKAGGRPWEESSGESRANSLGMKFKAVEGLEVMVSQWETRLQDYKAFIKETGRDWPAPDFSQNGKHPVVNVSWEDAVFFCRWLTHKEQKAGKLAADEYYRLPTSEEWTVAAGNQPGQAGSGAVPSPSGPVFSWGTDWPPPVNAGNFGAKLNADRFPYTAPVGSFAPNRLGLYDLEGNVREWCMDSFGESENLRVLRGSSWRMNTPGDIRLDAVVGNTSSLRFMAYGFRCVLAKGERSMAQK